MHFQTSKKNKSRSAHNLGLGRFAFNIFSLVLLGGYCFTSYYSPQVAKNSFWQLTENYKSFFSYHGRKCLKNVVTNTESLIYRPEILKLRIESARKMRECMEWQFVASSFFPGVKLHTQMVTNSFCLGILSPFKKLYKREHLVWWMWNFTLRQFPTVVMVHNYIQK